MNLFKWLAEQFRKIFGDKEVQPNFTVKPIPKTSKSDIAPPPPATKNKTGYSTRASIPSGYSHRATSKYSVPLPTRRDTTAEDFIVAAAIYGAISQEDNSSRSDDTPHKGFDEGFGGGHYSGGGSGGDYGHSSSSHDYGSSHSSHDYGSSHSSYDSGSSHSSYDSGSSYDSSSSISNSDY